MATHYNSRYLYCRTAKELITQFPALYGKDNYYMLYPDYTDANRQLVWCDMTTDGGGWMMIARTHPSGTALAWGWNAGTSGSIKDFTQPYNAGWYTFWHAAGNTFSEFIFGNRNNVNDNTWGPFIYKKGGFVYSDLITSETMQTTVSTTLKLDTTIYNYSGAPAMQTHVGYATSGTNANLYYLRDCCGWSVSYGIMPNRLGTTYIGDTTYPSTPPGTAWQYSGPFGAGNTYDSNGVLTQTTSTAYAGGTNQVMLMVR